MSSHAAWAHHPVLLSASWCSLLVSGLTGVAWAALLPIDQDSRDGWAHWTAGFTYCMWCLGWLVSQQQALLQHAGHGHQYMAQLSLKQNAAVAPPPASHRGC
jgi:hypothetical protein